LSGRDWLVRCATVVVASVALVAGGASVAQAHGFELRAYGYPAGSGLCQQDGSAGYNSWDAYYCAPGSMYPNTEDLWVHWRAPCNDTVPTDQC
jgi:hypothetical protein